MLGSKEDVRFDIFSYTGQYDAYLTARETPADPSSSKIFLRTSHGPDQTLIMRSIDRRNQGF